MLPYNAAQSFDKISSWVSYLLMIFVGGFILNLVLTPALVLVFSFLAHLNSRLAGFSRYNGKRLFERFFEGVRLRFLAPPRD